MKFDNEGRALGHDEDAALTLDDFVAASEGLLRTQRPADGQFPDAIHGGVIFGFDNAAVQACAFPLNDPTAPLLRPSCCAQRPTGSWAQPRTQPTTNGNCSSGSMDNNAFATINVLFLTKALEKQSGQAAAAAFLGRWLPALLRGLARIPSGTKSDGAGVLSHC